MKILVNSRILSVTLLLFLVFFFSDEAFCFGYHPKYIRVVIMLSEKSLHLKVAGRSRIFDASQDKILAQADNINEDMTVREKGIFFQGAYFKDKKIFLKPLKPDSIIINTRPFKGFIEIIRGNDNKVSVINYLDVEEYVKGILYNEISHYWPVEVMQAQAIVSRTYAYYSIEQNKAKDYDVKSDIYSQVYGGKSSERYRTNKAVNSTRSKVLTFEGNIFPAYFHATCAGHTEGASVLWGIDIAPLKGVECGFCKDSPHIAWKNEMPIAELAKKLNESGHGISMQVLDIAVEEKTPSGRVKKLKITGGDKEYLISGKDFRQALGPNFIKSLNLKINLSAGKIIFTGSGWGHGVGMCQWGAYFMAKQGRSYKDILEYYYPGSELRNG